MTFEYRARLALTEKNGVVDGDTLDLLIDLGFKMTRQERVRLLGIDAPEMTTAEGRWARGWVQSWLTSAISLLPRDQLEWPLVVRTEKPDPRDKYGRYLASVLCGGRDLVGDMLLAGVGVPRAAVQRHDES